MLRRLAFAALAVLLAACGQSAPPAPQAPAATPAPAAANPDAAQLSATPLPGQWFFNDSGEGLVSTGFGEPESEGVFGVQCERATHRVTLMYTHELAPDQDTQMRIVTAAQTLDLPARSFNDGLPSVNAALGASDPRLAALGARQQRFAVDVAGDTSVFPWDESIARVLQSCAE